MYACRISPGDSDNDTMIRVIADITHLKESKPPAVFWREPAKQFMTYIGFHLAQKGKNKGQRVRTPHYLGRDHREALLSAILIDQRWEKVVAETKQRAKLAEPIVGKGRVLPVWPTERQKAIREADAAQLEEMGVVISLPPGEEDEAEAKPYLSFANLKERYLAAQRARVGLLGRRGLKPYTLLCHIRKLERSLKFWDMTINILDLKREDYVRYVNYWLSPDRGVCERTAGNYCRAFKAMIDWADREEVCGFRKPKIEDLFCFANAKGHIERFDVEEMKKLLAAATERCQLYILLGLNTGMNQIDIANLKKSEIVEINGEMFIGHKREKTSHQNDFRTLHYLWPETWELLRKHMARDNAENLVLVNVNGRKLKRGKTDNIRDSINEAREASGIKNVTFKQLRKFGITAIKRVTGNPDIARMYAAHKIAGVLAHYDRDDFFDPLIEALKKWRIELKTLGIFDVKPEGRCYSDGKPRTDAAS
ncbi:MAG: tyrosine-type recombinase/integrase [Bacillota bacterium]